MVLPRRQLVDDSAIMDFLLKYAGVFDMYVAIGVGFSKTLTFEAPGPAMLRVWGRQNAGSNIWELRRRMVKFLVRSARLRCVANSKLRYSTRAPYCLSVKHREVKIEPNPMTDLLPTRRQP